MHHALVVDASVAIKWVIYEELTEQAQALLRANISRPMLAPPHMPSEVANALHQRVRTRDPANHISDDEADEALVRFLGFRVSLQGPPELYTEALGFSRSSRLPTVYDSLYVVLAHMTDTELWTADRRLYSAVRSTAPWVRWLGDYSSI